MRSHPKKQWKIGTVENCRHHWYLLIWIAYLVLFYIAEHVVTDHYWVSYLPLDDKIPFCRYFIIPYCMWHPLLFAMTLYLMWYDVPAFKRFMVYIGLGFGGSVWLFRTGRICAPQNSPSMISSSGFCSAFMPPTPTRTSCPACTSSAARR